MKTAFYAPMKPPDDATPSGDRRMARLFLEALEKGGFDPFIASTLRSRDGRGDEAVQSALIAQAQGETERLIAELEAEPPALWFTYHCYYKAPDLIGPTIANAFQIPYVIAEASRARKRFGGPWHAFAERAESAIDAASLVLAMTEFDRFALDRDAPEDQRVALFPPFLDIGADPPSKPARQGPLRLLSVAMMREGAKLNSYLGLAKALPHLEIDWTLDIVGDGPARGAVEAAFEVFGERVRFLGAVSDETALRPIYERADLFVWPGINEAFGMVYLEAQAAGTPVIAEDHPGPRAVIAPSSGPSNGPSSGLVPPDDPHAFAAAIEALAGKPGASEDVRTYIKLHHGQDAAAERLRRELEALL